MQKALALLLCIMHRRGMRSHRDIVIATGPDLIAGQRGLSIHTVRSWAQRNSIPADQWAWFAEQGHASLEELAIAVATPAAGAQEAA